MEPIVYLNSKKMKKVKEEKDYEREIYKFMGFFSCILWRFLTQKITRSHSYQWNQ